ncbi:MAG: diguanylate cyclase domain-containing protein [Candidatus Brocadiales bacterium]
MKIRFSNLLEGLLRADFDLAKRHRLRLSCIMLRIRGLESANRKQGADSPGITKDESLELLSKVLRSSDIITHYKEGQFLIVLLPMEDAERATNVCQRIRSVFTKASPKKLVMSMGISNVSDRNVNSPLDLIHCAETALNRALEKGGDSLCLWRDLT